MPKHIHRFYRQETEAKSKYMWKCTDCGWFVHAGLEYVMVGKPAVCWSCDTVFTISNTSLLDSKPKCPDCTGVTSRFDEGDSPLEKLRKRAQEHSNGIEVIEPDEQHAPDCEVYVGGECTCQ
jgi:predicted RNA-binding Zn-ribbon protein involved in translation (DUF1610 family)